MTTKRKPHPADLYEAEQIAKAKRFILYAPRFQTGGAQKAEYPTLPEAQTALPEFEKAHCRYGRRAMIYAISDTGTSYLVAAKSL
jgi:hypothetical protein